MTTTMEKAGVAVNTDIGRVICLTCGKGHLKGDIGGHLRNKHSLVVAREHADTIADYLAAQTDLATDPRSVTGPLSTPIPGLISYEGVKCPVTECQHYGRRERNWEKNLRQHVKTKHNVEKTYDYEGMEESGFNNPTIATHTWEYRSLTPTAILP